MPYSYVPKMLFQGQTKIIKKLIILIFCFFEARTRPSMAGRSESPPLTEASPWLVILWGIRQGFLRGILRGIPRGILQGLLQGILRGIL